MKVTQFNKPLMLMAIIAGASMNAVAFDTDAVQEQQTPYATEFKQLDINENMQLTWSETAKNKAINYNHFIEADKDSNKVLSLDEYAELRTEQGHKKVKQVVSDSAITAKVKAELLAEKNLKSTNISVETYKGDVILSGFVGNALTKAKAEKIASSVEGVKSVKNGLVIKS